MNKDTFKKKFKMNETFLLAGDKFMPEMHLRQPRFEMHLRQSTYSACELFTKNKKRIQKFKETVDSRYIYQNELNEACFWHDMAYENFKDLTRRTVSDKILGDQAFNIARKIKYDGYQRCLASMI